MVINVCLDFERIESCLMVKLNKNKHYITIDVDKDVKENGVRGSTPLLSGMPFIPHRYIKIKEFYKAFKTNFL